MPLDPATQYKMAQLERHALDILEHDGGQPVNERNKSLLLQASRHVIGLFSTLKQLDARLEKRMLDALSSYFSMKKESREKVESVTVAKEEKYVDPVDTETGGKKYKRFRK